MNDITSPATSSRESLERPALLRASGELSAADSSALDAALTRDDEAAEFARFVENELPLATKAPHDFSAAAIDDAERAPRDFAAAAIAAIVSEAAPRHLLTISRIWKCSAAAAAVAMLAFIVARQWPVNTAPSPVIVAVESRMTGQLTARLSALDDEISSARASLARSRYQRSTPL